MEKDTAFAGGLAERQVADGKPGFGRHLHEQTHEDNGPDFPACVPGGAGFPAPQWPRVLRAPVITGGSRREA